MECVRTVNNVNNILEVLEKYSDFNVEIFKTHNLAENKYMSLNKEFNNFSTVDDETVNAFLEKILEFNSKAKIISL